MPAPIDLRIDVRETVGLGMPLQTAATVFLPERDALADPPVVCFAFPGGGYSRGYYSFDMPDDEGGGQAGWHVARGWIFVAADHLGFGDSSNPDGDVLDYERVALGNKGTVEHVMARLADGTLLDGYPPVTGATTLGIGQSMGGCFTIVLQGQHNTFDAVASLGFSGIHTNVPSRPGTPEAVMPWMRRGEPLTSAPLNPVALMEAAAAAAAGGGDEHPMQWAFHWDDEPAQMVEADMTAQLDGELPPWRSATVPSCAIYMVAPGTVATEAAAITSPVLLAMGERDVIRDPWMEPFAFRSSTDVTLYVCPRMAHMHNFASTRHRFWARIHAWGEGVAATRGID